MGRPGRHEVEVAERQADEQREDRRRQRRVEERTGRPAMVGVRAALDEEEAGVGEPGPEPEHDAQDGVAAVARSAPSTPEMSTTPMSTSGTDAATRAPGRSPRKSHAAIGTITTWVLPRTVAKPGADLLDGVVPQHEVGGEERAGDPRQPGLPGGARPVPALFVPGQQRRAAAGRRRSGRWRPWPATRPRAARRSPRRRWSARRGRRSGRAGRASRRDEGAHRRSLAEGRTGPCAGCAPESHTRHRCPSS